MTSPLLFEYRYFPFGVDGMLAGSAIVFFSYIGFDSVASAAEEVIYIYCLFVFLYTQSQL